MRVTLLPEEIPMRQPFDLVESIEDLAEEMAEEIHNRFALQDPEDSDPRATKPAETFGQKARPARIAR